jgi:hypothetical protein
LTHKVTQQKRHRGKTQKKQFWKVFDQKRAGALFPKERSVIALFAKLWGSVGALLTQGQGRQVQKLPEMSKNKKKLQFNFDNYAEYDGVGSQSSHETNQKRSEPGLNQSRGRTRSMRRNQNKKFRFEAISPVESPVSVVGKSPCGQVDHL